MSRASPVRILGIDPGLGVTGYGVVEKTGATLVYVASGRIVSNPSQALSQRLSTILEGLNQVIESFQPVEVAVEQVFVNVNPQPSRRCCWARRAARPSARRCWRACRFRNTRRCR
jgi:crossover junction endodeoxyribonuclease RuvC